MEKIKSTMNLLKTMLSTSYDLSNLIDAETKKLNKKSSKVWLLGIVCILVLYLSNAIVNELAKAGAADVFLNIFFLMMQILILFQSILLGINVLYCSNDLVNYLHLPISNMKLLITKFIVMLSVIFGTELVIVLPSLYIYGAKVAPDLLIYIIVSVLAVFLISIFLAVITIIIMIPVMRLFRFIKNKYWYQTIIVLLMTSIMITPIIRPLLNTTNSYEEQLVQDDIESLKAINEKIYNTNKYYVVGELGIQALSECNANSFFNIGKILLLDIIGLAVFLTVGKFTYIKDVLWHLSLFDKKKNKRINLNKRCKVHGEKRTYVANDINNLLKNSTFFMHYIYNVLIIVGMIIMLAVIIVPVFKQAIIENMEPEALAEISFDFESFSIILGIVQALFTISPISLTAFSRYGKTAIFFKYIPIEYKTQFRLKNIPQLIMNTIIIISVLVTIYYLFPEINYIYLLLMFVIAMLLNIINSYILLLIDLRRPQLNVENEISVVEQNDNKWFKYIVTVGICVILWYLYRITKELSLNMAILIEIIVFSSIVLILEIIIEKNKNKLFERIQ